MPAPDDDEHAAELSVELSSEPTAPLDRRSAQHGRGAELDGLGRQLADLARQLQQQESPQAVLDRVVAAAVALVPGAREATISRVRRRHGMASVAATTEHARAFDDLQRDVGQGPCLDAVLDHRTVRVDDLATDTRWPALARRAGQTGVASALCFQLHVQGDVLGALNVLAQVPAAFDDESEDTGQLLAAHAAVAVSDAERLVHVRAAMDSRDLIGQAKGILMAGERITAEQAFNRLTRHSQDTNRKLRDVAADVAATGALERTPRERPAGGPGRSPRCPGAPGEHGAEPAGLRRR